MGESAIGWERGETLWDTGYDGPLGDDDDNNVDVDNILSSDENENNHDDNGDDREGNVGNIGKGNVGAGGERDSPRF